MEEINKEETSTAVVKSDEGSVTNITTYIFKDNAKWITENLNAGPGIMNIQRAGKRFSS